MAKVLFISNFHDGTGWAHAAIDYALALDAAGVDVVVRTLNLSPTKRDVPVRIQELEAKPGDGCDVCIQMVLPHMLEHYGVFRKNIAMFFTETDNYRDTEWPAHINKMDEAWVPCELGKYAALASGVTIPVHVVHYPSDVSKFARDIEPLKLRQELGDRFLFYTIGEMVKRKNLAATLRAFHLEFGTHEPVDLLIKTSGVSRSEVIEYCNGVKRSMKLYPDLTGYKQEMVLTDYLSEDDMLRLHATGDCYVGPSYGEGWGIPAFEAMAMGKTPIVSNWGAFRDYITCDEGWLVEGHLEPVVGMDLSCPFPGLYSSRERWYSVDVYELRDAMRTAYELRDDTNTSVAGMQQARKFSYQRIGKLMKGLLNEQR